MENLSPQKVYKVRDLNEAAALLCEGFNLLMSEADANGRIFFIFSNSAELQMTTKSYWTSTLSVDARHYADAIKFLKNLIYKYK